VTENAPTRLFLADHLLRDAVGHHLGYNLSLADGATKAGVKPYLVAHRAFDASLAKGVPCHRIFRTDFRADPPVWIARNHRLLRLLEKWCDLRFQADLVAFPAVSKTDAVFAQMIAPRHFLRWIAWWNNLPTRPGLFLHLGYRPERFGAPKILHAVRSICPGEKDRIAFVTDSEKLVGPLSEKLGAPVHYLPHVISFETPEPSPRQQGAAPVIFVPGNARREKGFAEVLQAIRVIHQSQAGGRFVIQRHDPDPYCRRILEGGVPQGESVEWIDHPLPESEYIKRLASADAVLLPYHLDCYERRTSGVFCEARVCGKPVIASKSTWAGDRILREGGGWLVPQKDTAALVSCLRTLPETIAEKTSEAMRILPKAREEVHRDGFIRGLVELFQKGAHGGA
jgi:glycosyltransferase involved in cell wall biosynthesis